MYGMVLMAALTTGAGTPDFGYFGFGSLGWDGWGGYGLGWGGYGSGWGGWGLGYGGYGYTPMVGGYVYSPMVSSWGWGYPVFSGVAFPNPAMTRSFYYSPAKANPGIEAKLVVHLPPQAKLTVDDNPTFSRSDTRVFITPPLDPNKTYTYMLMAEMNLEGRFVRESKTVEVKGGELTEVTLRFGDVSREELGLPTLKLMSK
jgi:uncharacterized protein (TIGR03000 family)